MVAEPETGPFIYTFTFRLPFVLGIADGIDHEMAMPTGYVDEHDEEVFKRPPFVRLRIFNASIADRQFCPANMGKAIEYFFKSAAPGKEDTSDHRYEQWITLETPAVFLVGERNADPAFAFHRGLWSLNLFLQSFALARGADWVRSINARELRPIVMIGSMGLDGEWTGLRSMLMHPDAKERPLLSRSQDLHAEQMNRAKDAIIGGEPFVPSHQWRARAERRKYEGDSADAVISFQIAVESLAYDLWLMLLVDEGKSSVEIGQLRETEIPFKSLLTRELGPRLGGNWDLTWKEAPVGGYWNDLYGLRNRMIHTGYLPHDGDSESAENAYVGFDAFLEEQLHAKARKYPRSLLVKVGAKEVRERGWATRFVEEFIGRAESETAPFFLPRDVAGR